MKYVTITFHWDGPGAYIMSSGHAGSWVILVLGLVVEEGLEMDCWDALWITLDVSQVKNVNLHHDLSHFCCGINIFKKNTYKVITRSRYIVL